MRIISFGDLYCDYYFRNNILIGVMGGKSGANILCNLSKKYNCTYIGVVGNDTAGDICINSLNKLNVDTTLIKVVNQYTKKFFTADFDCRAFNVPKEDVCNCVIWRQKDAERNSVQMLAQSMYKHKELMGISCKQLQNKMLTEKDVNWNNLPTSCKRGTACKKNEEGKWYIDYDMPILTEDRKYIEDLIYVGE